MYNLNYKDTVKALKEQPDRTEIIWNSKDSAILFTRAKAYSLRRDTVQKLLDNKIIRKRDYKRAGRDGNISIYESNF